MQEVKQKILDENGVRREMRDWGKNLGAECTKDEKILLDKRKNNLCVYVGKKNKQTIGFTTLVKHHWCCFGNIFYKVIQVEGRKQLGLNFGSDGEPNCEGLTLAQLMSLDFEKIDLSKFIEDFKVKFFGKYKSPSLGDMTARVKGNLPDICKYDDDPNDKANNNTGWNTKVVDDSWEAEEERRLAKEMEVLRKVEEERLAGIRAQEDLMCRRAVKA